MRAQSLSWYFPSSVFVKRFQVSVLNLVSYTQNGRMFLEQPSMSQPVVFGNIVKKKIVYILTGHENCIGFYFRIEQKEPPNNNGEREKKSFFMVI